MKDTFSDIMNQIKTVIFIYLMIIILHILSSESNLGNVLIATMVSFLMVVISIVLKNLIKRPNLPGFAWATLVSFFLTLPISPLQGIIVESMEHYIFSLVGLPLLAFAGISVGDQLSLFKDLSWKIVIVSFVVMASTYFGSALISNFILSIRGLI
ncbi:MAG TPA: hypothetical protein VK071_13690 [Tissierellales bacterium]|nr:hypothetical protein [Tissierellales bacterium]